MKIVFTVILMFSFNSMAQTLTETLGSQPNPSVNVGESFNNGYQLGQKIQRGQMQAEQLKIQNDINYVQKMLIL